MLPLPGHLGHLILLVALPLPSRVLSEEMLGSWLDHLLPVLQGRGPLGAGALLGLLSLFVPLVGGPGKVGANQTGNNSF